MGLEANVLLLTTTLPWSREPYLSIHLSGLEDFSHKIHLFPPACPTPPPPPLLRRFKKVKNHPAIEANLCPLYLYQHLH